VFATLLVQYTLIQNQAKSKQMKCLQFVIILYIDRLLPRERMNRIDSTQQTYIIIDHCTCVRFYIYLKTFDISIHHFYISFELSGQNKIILLH